MDDNGMQMSGPDSAPQPSPRLTARLLGRLNSNNPRLNLYLFLATCFTTFATGWLYNGYWQAGVWYGGGIIAILLAHEMGHYLMCRKHGVRATLPFFIPFPPVLNPFGTLGAVIRMESLIPSRRALFDIAVAGPLAGLALTLPAIYFGVQMSTVVETAAMDAQGAVQLGESLLYKMISSLAMSGLSEGQDILLHPLAYAGWAGLFVTALNLLPIGQLDGGHIVYALIGKHHRVVALSALAVFGAVTIFIYPGWALLFALLFWLGRRHPPTLDERPLDAKRIAIGIATLIVFFLSFTLQPIS